MGDVVVGSSRSCWQQHIGVGAYLLIIGAAQTCHGW